MIETRRPARERDASSGDVRPPVTPPPGVHVRPRSDGDVAGILSLFEACFGRPLSTEHYRWKTRASGIPGLDTAFVAHRDGRIVGHYACTPFRFRLDGETITAAHACDVMTAPELRRRGILTAVGTAANAAWARAGLAFTSGLHYDGSWGSRRGFLGWEPMLNLIWMRRILRPALALARRRHVPPVARRLLLMADRAWKAPQPGVRGSGAPEGVTIRPLSAADEALDGLWERLGRTVTAAVIRDRAWIDYRYFQAPHGEYRVLLAEHGAESIGYVVLRLTRERSGATGWIADLLAAREDATALLLDAALATLRHEGADQVRVLVAERSPCLQAFRAAGFRKHAGRFDAAIVRLTADATRLQLLRDPARWHVMGGDFDVV